MTTGAGRVVVRSIACIELCIGIVTICFVVAYSLSALSEKPLNVFVFVITTALASAMLGAGLYCRREWARKALIFFSGYIILTKFLIAMGLMGMRGEIVTVIPSPVKTAISFAYHALVIFLLTRRPIRDEFTPRHETRT